MRLQIGNVTFDAAARQLWVDGIEVHVSPKAFDLLGVLIERRPEAVSKQELHARLWPGTFVSDSSLPSLISELREAIADRHRTPKLLRTVHAFGYAFQSTAGVTIEQAATDASPTGWLVGTPAEIALFAGENVLGREGPGVLLLRSGTVSRRHARITIHAERAVIEDLGSKNGTFVNGQRVTRPTPVADGTEVRIGSLLFTFRVPRPARSTETLSSHHGSE
jgi:DNA-binding winged helix-turn-helix (wHTH) protein